MRDFQRKKSRAGSLAAAIVKEEPSHEEQTRLVEQGKDAIRDHITPPPDDVESDEAEDTGTPLAKELRALMKRLKEVPDADDWPEIDDSNDDLLNDAAAAYDEMGCMGDQTEALTGA